MAIYTRKKEKRHHILYENKLDTRSRQTTSLTPNNNMKISNKFKYNFSMDKGSILAVS